MKLRKIALYISLLLLLLSPSVGFCSEMLDPTQQTVTLSMNDYQTLRENNRQQAELLTELENQLSQAKIALTDSKEALRIARQALTESEIEQVNLLTELTKQKEELLTLRSELSKQKTLSESAENSLEKANQYLSDTRNEIMRLEEKHRRTERQLRTQKTLWQILASFLVVYAVQK